VVTARTLHEAFGPPFRGTSLEPFSFGPEGIAGHFKTERLELTLGVDVELSDETIAKVESQIDGKRHRIQERFLRYQVTIAMVPKTGVLGVADESLVALRDDGQVKTSRAPFIETCGDQLYLRHEGQALLTYHKPGLDHTLVSRRCYPPHYPHSAAFRQELAQWEFFYLEPRERMRPVTPTIKHVPHIGHMGEELAAFLNTLRETDLAQFRAIERSLHTLVPRVTAVEAQPNAVGDVDLRLVEDGMPISTRLMSDGTLCMLGLLAVASAKEPSTLIAIEEPENGIYPSRIRMIAELLETQAARGRQMIVTTHSLPLLDIMPYDALYVCRRDHGWSTIRPLASDRGSEDTNEASIKPSERILRGEFGEFDERMVQENPISEPGSAIAGPGSEPRCDGRGRVHRRIATS